MQREEFFALTIVPMLHLCAFPRFGYAKNFCLIMETSWFQIMLPVVLILQEPRILISATFVAKCKLSVHLCVGTICCAVLCKKYTSYFVYFLRTYDHLYSGLLWNRKWNYLFSRQPFTASRTVKSLGDEISSHSQSVCLPNQWCCGRNSRACADLYAICWKRSESTHIENRRATLASVNETCL